MTAVPPVYYVALSAILFAIGVGSWSGGTPW
jgi:hypothetical protein